MKKTLIFILCLLPQINYSQAEIQAVNQETTQNINQAIKSQDLSYADIVEPLIPSVVNVYTSQNPNKRKFNGKSSNNKSENKNEERYEYRREFRGKNFFFEDLDKLFEEFGLEIPRLDEMYSDPRAVSLGSGFVMDKDGYIVTNNHVVQNADEINIKFNDGTELPAKIIGTDKKTDIALLKVDSPKPLEFAVFGNSSVIRVGDRVFAIGNPFGLNSTVTTGIVSSKSRDIDLSNSNVVDYIQTDASINRGNSGGPMFNKRGEVIGVNTVIYSPSGGSVGIGFAIPSNLVKDVVEQLKINGKVTRGLLNIKIQDVTKEISEGLGLGNNVEGVLVVEVEKGGSGEKAGLKSGDIITKFNDTAIKNSKKLQGLVNQTKVGTQIKIEVLRLGKILELKTLLTENKDDAIRKKELRKSDSSSREIVKNGIHFEEAYQKNDENDDDENDNTTYVVGKGGVIVSKIDKNSTWRGLMVGDLVLSIGQKPVKSLDEFEKLYLENKSLGKKNLVLQLKRRNMLLFLALPII